MLDEVGSPATMGIAGPRFFGFVIGGALPAALGANWLASAWDQNAGLFAATPISATLEEVSLRWLLDALALPPGCGGAFVTGATVANFTALAAARHAVARARRMGRRGPRTLRRAAHSGSGQRGSASLGHQVAGHARDGTRTGRARTGGQRGAHACRRTSGLGATSIVCVQAGNVNTGSFDPVPEICRRAHAADAWVHVDGAFGLWAAASPRHAHLVAGVADADSWATDAHKWLNVPYDSGLAFVRDAGHLAAR